MREVRISVWIRRPAPEVFARLADFSAWPKWQAGLAKASKVSMGPLRAGSQVRLIRKGTVVSISQMQVTHMMPNELFGVKGSSHNQPWNRLFMLEPGPGGTRLRLNFVMHGGMGFLGQLAIRIRLARELQRFKALLEGG
jgi:hypothetical protein